MMARWWGKGAYEHEAEAVNGEVLAELRAIREEIHALTERVAASATREDLQSYVTKEVFDAHVVASQRANDVWYRWAPSVVGGLAVLWAIVGQHIHFS